MLYQPSYPYPYLSDIDATESNTFYCYINAEGGTTVKAYALTINDLSGNQIYTSTQTLVTPLYSQQVLYINVPSTSGMSNGQDYVWNIKLVESNADIWVAFGTIQEGENTTTQLVLRKNWLVSSGDWIVINNQKVKMITYDSTTGIATLANALTSVPSVGTTYNIYSDNVKSSDYLFSARSSASLSIDNVPQVVNAKSYTFTGEYTQEQGINYKYFIWTLYDDLQNPLATTGEVNTGNIEYTFDGFVSGSTYGIGLVLENQDGTVISVPPQYFRVEYQSPEIFSAPHSQVDCDKNAIRVYWTPLLINTGVAEGTSEQKYSYVYNTPYDGGVSVNINSGCDITWDIGSEGAPVPFNYDSTTYLHWHTDDTGFNGIIYKQEGKPIDLVAISPTPPATAQIGDKYYNTTTNYIYTAVEANTWGMTGVEPSDDIMYKNNVTDILYIYNGNSLQSTTYQPPSYIISYSAGSFYYEISNGDFVKNGSVKVADIQTLWLLQAQDVDPQQVYAWIDKAKWDDSLYWTESTESYINKYWFKITLLPTGIQVVTIPIEDI